MPDGLYERDALQWSEQQAGLLRRLASGERVNDAVDWSNVIEEVESVGRSELRACESAVIQALVHLLKLRAWPDSQARPHWSGEVVGFLSDAQRAFTPSMRQRIDLSVLYETALRKVGYATENSGPPRLLAAGCALSLDELLAGDFDVDGLVAGLGRL